mmetsp:Transcript_18797/g.34834  ORF Transcript_18797/g.34834 Transcript_18797/m.34834 type:complete len:128 (-) Transcript_18797:385-768(-)
MLSSEEQVREVLRHELVHAFDHCVKRRDLASCDGLACSEVRAAREAECRDNFGRGPGELCHFLGVNPFQNLDPSSKLTPAESVCYWFKKRCARDVAIRSVEGVFPGYGTQSVDEALETCHADTHPYA